MSYTAAEPSTNEQDEAAQTSRMLVFTHEYKVNMSC